MGWAVPAMACLVLDQGQGHLASDAPFRPFVHRSIHPFLLPMPGHRLSETRPAAGPETRSAVGPRVYLAGPDIFHPDQEARYRRLEALCEAQREGAGGPPPALAHRIYTGNVRRIGRADAVLANLAPFRNPVEPDSGTVFEIGMAVALGKPVLAYLRRARETHAARIVRAFGEVKAGEAGEASGGEGGRAGGASRAGLRYDAATGLMIEDLGLPMNLMLGCAVRFFHATPQEAAAERVRLLAART